MALMPFNDFLAAKSREGNTAFVAGLSPEDAKVFLADLAEHCFWQRYRADIAELKAEVEAAAAGMLTQQYAVWVAADEEEAGATGGAD